jgi:hypothetical protein
VPCRLAILDACRRTLSRTLWCSSLCERLRHRWHVGAYESEDVVLVVAELRPRQDDLAILLRAVKLWLLDNGLGALRFHLDGRAFVLESNPALLRGAAA